jgi:hypothetical protein
MSHIFNSNIVAIARECAEKGGISRRALLFAPFSCEVYREFGHMKKKMMMMMTAS